MQLRTLYRLALILMLCGPAVGSPRGARAAQPAQPHAAPQAAVDVSADLGTVVTVEVYVDNTGQSAGTAQLYEALAAPTALAFSPPAEQRVPLPDEAGPVTAGLAAAFEAAPSGTTEFIIYLAEQADLSAAAALPDWNERGAAVVATLRAHAAKTQTRLLGDLRARGSRPTAYWIVNAVAVSGNRALAEWAATQPGVALVAASEIHQLDEVVGPQAETPAMVDNGGLAWGIEQIEAPGVWADWGVRGGGIVLANIDTGVAYTHSALLESYRGWNAGSVDHNYNWFDGAAEPPKAAPLDDAGHGTHVMGTMVGRAAGDFTNLGVAPQGRWIAARGCAGIFCTDTALISSAQWLLAPTNLAGSAPRPDLRPHIINNSWGKFADDSWYVGYVEAWNASGMFSVFANGNNGAFAVCGTSGSPGQYAQAFSVGATDAEDFVASFSSRGPATDGRIKPDLSAPGVAVPSAWMDGGIRAISGTSMAAPHVSGVVALLWSANPALIGDLAATHALLTGSAEPRTSPECGPSSTAVPNNVYGWGRLNARQAVQAARVDVPWLSVPPTLTLPADGVAPATLTLDARQVSEPGDYQARLLVLRGGSLTTIPITFEVLPSPDAALVTGQLADAWSNGAVYGRLQVGEGPLVHTDVSGQFTMTLPFGSYTLTGAATGYISATQPLSVSGPTNASFSLMPDRPHLSLAAATPFSATLAFGEQQTGTVTLSNDGTRPLSVTVSMPSQEWVEVAAGVAGGGLYDVNSAPAFPLDDDEILGEPLALGFSLPIYGQVVSHIYLSSNGWISVAPPSSAAPFASCLTAASMAPGTLAAFWADLDPSVGGVVRAAQVDAETFVVSFENVPHWQASPVEGAPTYSFQIVLHASGEIDFVFGAMGELPARWAMGTHFSASRQQSLACYKTPVDLAHKRWTLVNQPPVNTWLTTTSPSVVVAPGSSAELEVVLKGLGYVPWLTRPNVGFIRLHTNDTLQPTADLAAEAVVGPAPYTQWWPIISR